MQNVYTERGHAKQEMELTPALGKHRGTREATLGRRPPDTNFRPGSRREATRPTQLNLTLPQSSHIGLSPASPTNLARETHNGGTVLVGAIQPETRSRFRPRRFFSHPLGQPTNHTSIPHRQRAPSKGTCKQLVSKSTPRREGVAKGTQGMILRSPSCTTGNNDTDNNDPR